MQNECTVGALASEFARRMRWYLTGEQMEAVLSEPKKVYCCKTHDFLDANVVMLESLDAMNGGVTVEFNDSLMPLITAAWDLARDNRWWVPHFVSETGHCEDCGGCCEFVIAAYEEYVKHGLV